MLMRGSEQPASGHPSVFNGPSPDVSDPLGDSGAADTTNTIPRQLSVFDMFQIGIGPSSSHTVGPMRAGLAFATELSASLPRDLDISHISVDLFGSLAATGRGHNTDRAALLGLSGYHCDTVDIDTVENIVSSIATSGHLNLNGTHMVPFNMDDDIHFYPHTILPYHVNALTINASSTRGDVILSRTYYSVGGGFVMIQTNDDTADPQVAPLPSADDSPLESHEVPYPFTTGDELLEQCQKHRLSIADLVRCNEEANRTPEEIDSYIDLISATMFECINAGAHATGILPGGLFIPRRANTLMRRLCSTPDDSTPRGKRWFDVPNDPLRAMDWVNVFAMAVNEENAAGHRVVTAPTNGAAGVIPAMLGYLISYCPEAGAQNTTFTLDPEEQDFLFPQIYSDHDGAQNTYTQNMRRALRKFIFTATAIGSIIKINASIAGAEVGCQGEVGSASAMAAGGLAAALGGTVLQVENAAEIAMEHSLGLTCDPVAGLVQIPCIERNAIAAVKAIDAARMALWGDGHHRVTLDMVIETMRQTGEDMHSKYKETSEGGLAVNVVEC